MNWMNNWEKAQEKNQDERESQIANPLKDKNELEHQETLVKDDILFILNEIAHGQFNSAKESLLECKARYSIVNPELQKQIDDIEDMLKNMQQSANNTNDDKQLNLPL